MLYDNLDIRQELELVYGLSVWAGQVIMQIKLETITTKENLFVNMRNWLQWANHAAAGTPSQTIVLSRNLSWHYHSDAAAVAAVEDECFVGMQKEAAAGTSEGWQNVEESNS